LYRNGKGVPLDFAKAYFWFDLATAAEQDASLLEQTTKYKATKHRDEAAFHLTPANLSREQERVRKWFEAHQAKPQ
jgi:TPR repeat protein